LNVYFELGPDDDYQGKPIEWRRRNALPRPSSTVALAENATTADHLMAHFWVNPEDTADVASRRHSSRSLYTFVDGHARALRFDETWDPRRSLDRWNPGAAP
jgi:prepilin-type processing-associated H-X9-DG protein